jgi:steroid delta-isomerase
MWLYSRSGYDFAAKAPLARPRYALAKREKKLSGGGSALRAAGTWHLRPGKRHLPDVDSHARRVRFAAAAIVLAFLFGSAGSIAETPAETAIRDALTTWARKFNAGDADAVCNLFAPDLRYDYRGFPERGFDEICGLLRRSLSDRAKNYSYSLQIKEVIVAGDLAVVRLIWSLKIVPVGAAKARRSEEPGIDIFRKQPDGSWKIIRYIAYED